MFAAGSDSLAKFAQALSLLAAGCAQPTDTPRIHIAAIAACLNI
jgi:hypothetical protein